MAVNIKSIEDVYLITRYDFNTLKRVCEFGKKIMDELSERDKWFVTNAAHAMDFYTLSKELKAPVDLSKNNNINDYLHCIIVLAIADMQKKTSVYIDRQDLVKKLAAGLFFDYYNKTYEMGGLYGVYTDEKHS